MKRTGHALLLISALAATVSAAGAQGLGFFDPVDTQADTGAFGFTTDTTGGSLGPSADTRNQRVGVPTAEQGLMAIGAGFTRDACKLFGSGGFPGGGSATGNYGGLPKTATSLVDLDVYEP